jgi:hypothetical protein
MRTKISGWFYIPSEEDSSSRMESPSRKALQAFLSTYWTSGPFSRVPQWSDSFGILEIDPSNLNKPRMVGFSVGERRQSIGCHWVPCRSQLLTAQFGSATAWFLQLQIQRGVHPMTLAYSDFSMHQRGLNHINLIQQFSSP